MAETISELLVRIGADVSDVRSELATVESALSRLETASGDTANGIRKEFERGLFEGIEAEATRAATALGKVGSAKTNLPRVAGEIQQLSTNLTSLARAGDLSAVGIQQITLNVAQLADAAGLARGGIAGIVGTLAPIGVAAAAAVAAGRALAGGFEQMAESEKKFGDAIVRISDSSKGIADIDKIVAGVEGEFDKAAQATETYAEETERLEQAIRRAGVAEGVAQGQIDGKVRAMREARDATLALAAAADRQRIAAQQQAAALDALPDRARFLASLDVEVPEDTIADLQRLKDELEFEGPISQVVGLRDALAEADRTLRELAQQAGQDPLSEAVEQDIANAQAKLKAKFKADLKVAVQLDPTVARDEAARFVESIESTRAKITPELELANAVRQLDILRSRIADEPAGELKVALKAEASRLEQEIEELRAREESDPVTVPLDVDTTAAEAKVREFAGTLSEEFGDVESILSPVGDAVEVVGEVATGADLAATAFQLMQDAAQAMATSDLVTMRDLLFSATQFVEQFGEGLALVGNRETQNAVNQIEGVIASLSQRVGSLNIGLEQLASQFRAVAEASGEIQFNVTASGSPTMPFTDYFERHVPSVLAGIEAPSLTMPVAVEPDFTGFERGLSTITAPTIEAAAIATPTVSATDLTETNNLLKRNLEAHFSAIEEQRATKTAFGSVARALDSGRFWAGGAEHIERHLQNKTGDRGRTL